MHYKSYIPKHSVFLSLSYILMGKHTNESESRISGRMWTLLPDGEKLGRTQSEQKDETEQHDHLKCAQTGRAAWSNKCLLQWIYFSLSVIHRSSVSTPQAAAAAGVKWNHRSFTPVASQDFNLRKFIFS